MRLKHATYFMSDFSFCAMQKPGGIISLLDETWYAQVIVLTPFLFDYYSDTY
jgi:hypothetical protein